MATKRIKQLATLTPLATKYLAHEGDTGGTGKATITDVVASGCAALGISAPAQNQVVGYTEFDDAATGGGWMVIADKGDALVASTLGGMGFDSTGVAVMSVNVGGDFDQSVMLVRPATGLNCDEDVAPSIAYRFWTTHTVSGETVTEDLTRCTYALGAGGGSFGDEGPQSLIALVCNDGDWVMRTVNVDGTTEDPITMPSGESVQVRMNIILGGWTCEVSVDGGESYSLVGTSSVSPDLTTYIPLVLLMNDGPADTDGPRFTGVDWCAWTTVRSASHPGAFDGGNALHFPPMIKFGDDGDIQPVAFGGSNSAGDSGRFADAAHVHAGPSADTAIAFPPPVTQSSDNHTLTDADNGKTFYVTNAGLTVFTVPQNLTPGFSCSVQNVDAAATTQWIASGTQNVFGPGGFINNTVQYAVSGVIVRSTTHAALVGALDS